ncbi:MAG: type I methionyl aminopeptidase [Clostridia bacterium]|nr:type I methionyl aminopeptidase [Clostridia bacterium]
MVILKTSRELAIMREAGRISQRALRLGGEAVEPGVSTWEIDKIIREYIEKSGAKPNFLGYGDFPASACISVNNTVIHGIPSKKQILKKGDIVSIDTGALFNGFNGDNAWTFACGEVSEEAQRLMDTTREALFKGIEQARVGNRIGDIGHAVQEYVEARGYSVVRDFVGHGVGAKLHEDPSVPNYGTPGRGVRLLPGMVIAIEPMVNVGDFRVKVLSDGWTTQTIDGKLSAHFEHMIAITTDGPVILTSLDD